MESDLRDLLTAWLGGDVAADRRDELLARLRSDASFRRAFVDEIRMLGKLKAVQAPEPRWLQLEDELGASAPVAKSEPAFDRDVMASIRQLSDRLVPGWWRWVAVGCACASLALIAGWWGTTDHDSALIKSAKAARRTDRQLAVAVKVEGARWESKQNPAVVEGNIVAPGRVRLLAGRVTLAFFSGVVLNIEGPADVDLVSMEKVFCRFGKVRTQVPPGAEGFTVTAPGSAVVDLGTEVGLNVEPNGRAKLMVFEGKAQVSVLSAKGVTIHSRLLEEKSAVDIDPTAGRIRQSAVGESSFVAKPQMTVSALNLDPDYSKTIRGSRPWGYWRFESMTDGLVPNEIAGRPPLHSRGPLQLSEAVNGNRSVIFQAGAVEQSLLMDELWLPPIHEGYAFEFWFASEAFTRCTLAGLLSEKTLYHSLIELTACSRQLMHDPGSVRFLHRWPPGDSGGVNVFSGQIYHPYRWHHLVAQRNGERLELFIDGLLAKQSLADGGDEEPTPCRLLLGHLQKPKTPLISRSFVGRIDEFALYDHPLTFEEIQHHARLGSGSK